MNPDLVVAASMFTRDRADFLDEVLVPAEGTTCLVEDADDGRGLASVVLYRPEEAADRVFDVTTIAVRPDLQGDGRRSALMRHVEQDLREQGQRMLVIRTSGRYARSVSEMPDRSTAARSCAPAPVATPDGFGKWVARDRDGNLWDQFGSPPE
jgi:GNAT superfamily N-acetyltransferase